MKQIEASNESRKHAMFTHEHYKQILEFAISSGYRFVGFHELNDFSESKEFTCCLRHDCDNDLTAARQMAGIEQDMRVRSTYFLMLRSAMYNLLSGTCLKLAREIIDRGHDIGLHFDEHCYPGATSPQIVTHVDQELQILSREFGIPVRVVSFHQPSQRVLANEFKINYINTYDHNDMGGTHYISDTNTIWQESCPCQIFSSRKYQRLHLLIHPEWWTETEMSVPHKWYRMFQNNFELAQQSLLRRERTYTKRRTVLFEVSDDHTS